MKEGIGFEGKEQPDIQLQNHAWVDHLVDNVVVVVAGLEQGKDWDQVDKVVVLVGIGLVVQALTIINYNQFYVVT